MSVTEAKTVDNIKNNGSSILSCTQTGTFSRLDSGFVDTLTVEQIQNKYDTRFKEGILVKNVST